MSDPSVAIACSRLNALPDAPKAHPSPGHRFPLPCGCAVTDPSLAQQSDTLFHTLQRPIPSTSLDLLVRVPGWHSGRALNCGTPVISSWKGPVKLGRLRCWSTQSSKCSRSGSTTEARHSASQVSPMSGPIQRPTQWHGSQGHQPPDVLQLYKLQPPPSTTGPTRVAQTCFIKPVNDTPAKASTLKVPTT